MSFLIKNRKKSAFITSLGLVLFFSYGHLYIMIDELQKNVLLNHGLLIISSFILFGLGMYYFLKTKKPLNNATKIVNVVAISLIMISFVSIGEYIFTIDQSTEILSNDSKENEIQLANAENLPDIYYIIPDAYAGSKSLKTILNYDNSEFTDFLIRQGFYVPSESYSNYPLTKESIASTLNMKYINYLAEEKGIDSTDTNVLVDMSRDNLVVKYLKDKGYTIYSIQVGGASTTAVKNVDVYLCDRNKYRTSDFNMMLIRTSMLNPIHVQIFSGDQRDRLLCGFSELAKMAERDDSPKFVLTHFMFPHRPYIFGADGEPINPKFLALENKEENWDTDLYLGQLEFASKKLEEAIRVLTNTDDPPIIIIQSDHGMRGVEYQNEYEKQLRMFNNFKAYYFPEKGRNHEFETTTAVNTFRVLFNLYFDEDFEILEDKIWGNSLDKPYVFQDLTDILIRN